MVPGSLHIQLDGEMGLPNPLLTNIVTPCRDWASKLVRRTFHFVHNYVQPLTNINLLEKSKIRIDPHPSFNYFPV